MPTPPVRSDTAALRRELLKRRAQLTPAYRRRAALAALRHLGRWRALREFRRVACYWSVRSEFPTGELLAWLQRRGLHVYLPALHPRGIEHGLVFQRYRSHARMRRNRLGIPEPPPLVRERLQPRSLDLVITPLAGFDSAGRRLGMGGGYYDRTFCFLRADHRRGKPFLLGLAFATQEVAHIEAQPWDVPLAGVLTERGLREFPRSGPARATRIAG